MECLSEIEYKATTDILSTEWYSGRFSDICKFSPLEKVSVRRKASRLLLTFFIFQLIIKNLREKKILKMRPVASHDLRTLITSNVTVSQPGAELWKKVMGITIENKIKLTKNHLTVLLLTKLRERDQGTNEVEHFVKMMKSRRVQTNLRRSIMKYKIEDATSNKIKAEDRFRRSFEFIKRKVGGNSQILDEFRKIMQSEVESVWEEGRVKNKSKISFLIQKWKKDNDRNVDKEWRDILISEEKLREKFEPPATDVPNFGDLELSEAESKALALPPKFTTYENIDIKKIDADIRREIEREV